MKVAIHQPNYLPWAGYFKKMAASDVFVILDTVQFSRDSFTQRTKIRTKDGWMWLTIPIEKSHYFKLIKDVPLPQDNKWRKKHRISIASNYAKSNYFDNQFIDEYYNGSQKTLQEFNELSIFYLKKRLDINTLILRASELDIDKSLASTDLVIDIVKKVGGDTYISGKGADSYMDIPKFTANNIQLEYYQPPIGEYVQRWEKFEPYMSAIDMLFNVGRLL